MMRKFASLAVPALVLAKLALAGSAQPPAGLQSAIDSTLYRIDRGGAGYQAVNPSQHMSVRFDGTQTDFRYRDRTLSLSLVQEGPVLRSKSSGNRVDFEHARVAEWFINSPAGLEQGFTVAKRDNGKLSLTLETHGDLLPAINGGEIGFRDGDKIALRYRGLRSWDADGRPLPSRAFVDGRRIRLEVDDAGARYPVTIDPVVQQAVLAGSDATNGDEVGYSVALSADGNTALVGDNSNSQGAAYVFTRSGTNWNQQQKLVASDGFVHDNFGFVVALAADGNTALVGATGPGAAYVFTRSGNTWSQQKEFTPSDSPSSFGFAVALSADGQTAVIGTDAGSVYIFIGSAGTWAQQKEIAGSSDNYFGNALALSGDGNTLLVGASGYNSGQGAAYVFTRSQSTWTQQKALLASDGVGDDNFGYAVALNSDGTTALIGANRKNNHGAAYVFIGSQSTWSQQQELSPGAAEFSAFGNGVALSSDGNTALIGGANEVGSSAYIFVRSGTTWSQQLEMTGNNNINDDFGYAVALSGDGATAIVGAPDYRSFTGAAYVFALSNVSITSIPAGQLFTLTGSDCPTGTFQAPYSGYWSQSCAVQWISPNTHTRGTRYTLQSWSDGDTENPRTLPPLLLSDASSYPYGASFLTEYQLTTTASPPSGGQLTPGTTTTNWYAAGTTAQVNAYPNPGFVFIGFSGALTGDTWPGELVMNSPLTVNANFNATPTAAEGGVISAKTGAPNARQWNITLTNSGPGVAYDMQVFGLMFTQTFGTACAPMPVRSSPVMFPVAVGNVGVNGSAQTAVTLDFSGCPSSARFTVSVGYMANGGASVGLIQLVNQLQ